MSKRFKRSHSRSLKRSRKSNKKYKSKSRKLNTKSRSKSKSRSCIKKNKSKYLNRPSPPYPANECCGEVKEGNDGNKYISKKTGGVCRWVKTHLTKSIEYKPQIDNKFYMTSMLKNKDISPSDIELYTTMQNGGDMFDVILIPKLKYTCITVNKSSLKLYDYENQSDYKKKIVQDFYNDFQSTGLTIDVIKPVKFQEKKKKGYLSAEELSPFKLRFNYERVFIGDIGSNILFKLSNGKYMFICGEISIFNTPNNEEIKEYYGPIGYSAVPEPYGFSDNYIYLLGMIGEYYYFDINKYKDWLNEKGISWEEGKKKGSNNFDYSNVYWYYSELYKSKKNKYLINKLDFTLILNIF
jgi:hypothetical protein